MKNTQITSYAQGLAWLEAGRFPHKGRALSTFARLWRDDATRELIVKIHGEEILRVTPFNTLRFTCSTNTVVRFQCSISSGLHKITPFVWWRVNTRVWSLSMWKFMKNLAWRGRRMHARNKAPKYFEGIELDMDTGMVLNEHMRPAKVEYTKEQRKEFNAAAKQYVNGFMARLRIGLADDTQKGWINGYDRSMFVDALGRMVRQQMYPEEMYHYTLNAYTHWPLKPNREQAEYNIKAMFKNRRNTIRDQYFATPPLQAEE